MDNDSRITEAENIGNIQESESTQKLAVAAEWGQKDWNRYTDYNYWYGVPNWNQNLGPPIPTKGNGSYDKRGNRNPVGKRRELILEVKSIRIAIGL